MILQTGKKFAALLFAALLFAVVISGGCGGSSSSDYTVANIDTVINGAWRVDTSYNNKGSADINGTEINLAVRDFAFFAKSADMNSSNGTVYLEAVAVLSSDRVLLPLLMDTRSFDTTFIEGNTWLVGNDDSTMFITVDTTTPKIHLYGRASFNNVNTHLDVTFSKITADDGPTADDEINTFLNGTWQSPINGNTGGGFAYINLGVNPEYPELPSRTALSGMLPINTAFANIIFNDTDISDKTTNLTTQALLTLLPGDVDNMSGPVESLVEYDYPVTGLTREFGNIYKFVITDTQKAVLLVHGQKAYFIISSFEQEADGFEQTCALFELDKKPSRNSITLTDKPGTTWRAYGTSGQVMYSEDGRMITEPLILQMLMLTFPAESFDVENKSVGVKIDAEYSEFLPDYAPELGVSTSPDVIPLSMERELINIDNVGCNTFYAGINIDGSERVIITFLNDNTALLSARLINHEGDWVNMTAMMHRVDDVDEAFFPGGLIAKPSDNIAINSVDSQ